MMVRQTTARSGAMPTALRGHGHAWPWPWHPLRAALTLLELVVVLLILAVLTLVAVQSTEGLVGQGRFEANQRTLDNVRAAIAGPADGQGPGGTPAFTGFVADVGRLPQTVSDGGTLTLQELWDDTTAVAVGFPFKEYAAAGEDADVKLYCGWRGPYVRLATGASKLYDGWGRELANVAGKGASLYDAGGVAITAAGKDIARIRSLGEDGALGGAQYSADVDAVILPTNYKGTVQGSFEIQMPLLIKVMDGAMDVTSKFTFSFPDPGLTVAAKVFAPDATAAGLITITGPPNLASRTSTATTVNFDGSFSFPEVTCGARMIRAKINDTALVVTANPTFDMTGTYDVSLSDPVPIAGKTTPFPAMVMPGPNTLQRLRIPVAAGPVVIAAKKKM